MAKPSRQREYDRDYSFSSSRATYGWWKEYRFHIFVAGIIIVLVAAGFILVASWLDNLAMTWRGFVAGIWKGWLFPNGWNLFAATPFFYGIIAVVLIGLVLFLQRNSERYAFRTIAVILIAALWVGVMVYGSWNLNKHGAQYYLGTTTFKVEDENNLPSVLQKQARSDESMVSIKEGKLPTSWVSRDASLTGALNVMKRTGDAINNTELMTDTATYLYGDGGSGQWTAIRNGVNRQAVYGVASWNGTGDKVTTCEFEGNYELNKAFNGRWGQNLSNAIAGAEPSFLYDEGDMWGYCDGNQPVIVIPGVYTRGYDLRTVDESAGVVTVKGSPSGEPKIQLLKDVKAGEFPGPVYPQRMVDQQRNALSWAAGRHLNYFENFGFEQTDVESQAGNNADYLMKNETNGRLYWVTPMKPRSTDSQTLIAYSITPADEVKSHVLNAQSVYVLNEDDARVVNLDDLLARVTDAVRDANPGFFTGKKPGKIVEFLPVSDKEWQVFAEVNGRVKYRIDVDVNARITPNVVDIESGDQAETPGTSTPASCNVPSSLSDAQLAECLAKLAQELQSRQEPSNN